MFKTIKHTYAYLNIYLSIGIYKICYWCRSSIIFFYLEAYNILKFSNKDVT